MPSIRRQILIAAAPRTVWRSLTTGEGLAEWWADEARIDARKGGRVVVVSLDDEGQRVEEHGIIHTWRPTSHLEIAFDRVGPGPLKGTRLAFQVAVDGGETRVALVHSGEAFDDAQAHERMDKQWRQALRALQGQLDSDDSSGGARA